MGHYRRDNLYESSSSSSSFSWQHHLSGHSSTKTVFTVDKNKRNFSFVHQLLSYYYSRCHNTYINTSGICIFIDRFCLVLRTRVVTFECRFHDIAHTLLRVCYTRPLLYRVYAMTGRRVFRGNSRYFDMDVCGENLRKCWNQ